MSAPRESDTLERERLDADARYNDALTAFDRAVAECRSRPFGDGDFERLSHALIVYLQHITAFVDTKDRAIASQLSGRIEHISGVLGQMDELRTRLNVLQRRVSQQQTASGEQSTPVGERAPIQPVAQGSLSPADAVVYVGFEDAFRGPDDAVAAKLAAYLPIFTDARDVLDLGCGRGEFLDALRSAGIPARGVDTNVEMVAVARERGLAVERTDALTFLQTCPDESLGGAIATQVIEHLQPAYLVRLLETLPRKLRPGAPIVLETINPACWLAFFSSYIRDFTHVQPIHPDTLQYLLRAVGFERVEIRYSAPVTEQIKMKTVDPPAAMLASTDPLQATVVRLAHTVNTNAAILNSLLFTYLDYAAVAFRP